MTMKGYSYLRVGQPSLCPLRWHTTECGCKSFLYQFIHRDLAAFGFEFDGLDDFGVEGDGQGSHEAFAGSTIALGAGAQVSGRDVGQPAVENYGALPCSDGFYTVL